MSKVAFDSWIENLAIRIEQGLPGESAHLLMVPAHRKTISKPVEGESNYRTAAVLALIVPDAINNLPRLVLIERSEGPVSHSGQISFPGGKREGDEDLLVTALREANEELGIPADEVKLLGSLTSLYIPPSNFMVHPFLGYMNKVPDFVLSESEVKRVLMPAVDVFLNNDNISLEIFKSTNGTIVHAPSYKVDDVTIWGATAMMIAEIGALLKS